MTQSPSGMATRLAAVQERIQAAAARARRDPAGILLIAVSKKFPSAMLREAYALGLRHFGENYVQEFEGKAPEVADLAGAHFHLIGHLQSNKARKAAEIFHTVQTIDSVKLAQRLDSMIAPGASALDVMIEVKLSEEDAKHGAAPEDVPAIAAALRAAKNLRLTGLMTMPPWSENAELSRPYFARLRELAARENLTALSMGMSNDLEVAIEEGATMIRVGTAIFGKRPKPVAPAASNNQ